MLIEGSHTQGLCSSQSQMWVLHQQFLHKIQTTVGYCRPWFFFIVWFLLQNLSHSREIYVLSMFTFWGGRRHYYLTNRRKITFHTWFDVEANILHYLRPGAYTCFSKLSKRPEHPTIGYVKHKNSKWFSRLPHWRCLLLFYPKKAFSHIAECT